MNKIGSGYQTEMMLCKLTWCVIIHYVMLPVTIVYSALAVSVSATCRQEGKEDAG